VCPQCGTLRKGKVCTQDGTTLVPLKDWFAYPSVGSVAAEADQVPMRVPPSIQADPTVMARAASVSPIQAGTWQEELVLISRNLGLNLVIRPGDVIGRSEGRFSNVFQGYKAISRRHCLFNHDPGKGWTVTDLGSTNGVDYDGRRLQPHQLQLLRPLSFLVIGNIEFFVEIRSQSSVDQTERVR
jgi:hypothetical protein